MSMLSCLLAIETLSILSLEIRMASAVNTLPIILILCGVSLVLLLALLLPKRKARPRDLPKKRSNVANSPTDFSIAPAPIGAQPKWLVMDLQTTGLSTVKGDEDRILEATWLVLDGAYRLIRRRTIWVQQESLGGEEARSVHHLSGKELERDGVSELDFLTCFFADLPASPITLVMHNAAFDFPILRAMVVRLLPSRVADLDRCPQFCTMKYPVEELGYGERYPRLSELSMRLLGISSWQFRALSPVSWRNAYFTRRCLIALIEEHL